MILFISSENVFGVYNPIITITPVTTYIVSPPPPFVVVLMRMTRSGLRGGEVLQVSH